jgi:hypothetical protein
LSVKGKIIEKGWFGFAADAYCPNCNNEITPVLAEFAIPRKIGMSQEPAIDEWKPEYHNKEYRNPCPVCGDVDWLCEENALEGKPCGKCGVGSLRISGGCVF